jgi:uncharacterized protein (TIGR00255 family)
MTIRSMTGFAQMKGQADAPPGNPSGRVGFTLSLKSVNHRFLDLHFRLPSGTDALEMKLRRVLKEKVARGHLELALNLEQSGSDSLSLNRSAARAYVDAFRAAAAEFSLAVEPDLNAILRMPGVLDSGLPAVNGQLDDAVLASLAHALGKLNQMREEEGGSIERELRQRMSAVREAQKQVHQHREKVLHVYAERLKARMQELMGAQIDRDRILQEAALLVDRSDVQEELVRLETHVDHFLGLLDQGGEVGKKLDFLLQEMNREANTLLSKTSGLAGEALKITEIGIAVKTEIEKAREQVQNLE